MRKLKWVVLYLFVCSHAIAGDPYEKKNDGIVVHIPHARPLQPHTLVIEAVTNRIIHVTAFPTDIDTPLPVSLLRANPQDGHVPYEVETRGDVLKFSTDSIQVLVSLVTGRVTFTDPQGNVLLREAPRDRPVFSSGNQVSATFVSPSGESLYGLGQQQNGFLNYKDRSVTLLQQNSSVAIPFVLSSRNYGLLWDNYSITRFGDIRDNQPLSCLILKDAQGKEGGLTATYTNVGGGVATMPFGAEPAVHSAAMAPSTAGSASMVAVAPGATPAAAGKVFTERTESAIDYAFLPDLSKLPKGYSLQDGIIRWTGSIGAHTSGLHQFLLYAGGYVRVWINDKLVVDRWRQCWNPETVPFDLSLDEGKFAAIRVEWKPDGAESYISLKCLPPCPPVYRNTYSFTSEVGDAVNYYFIKGSDLDEVIGGYRTLTGKAPIMPRWAMGLWQSRERYKTEAEIRSTVQTFREQGIPLDNIVLDWQYWRPDQWGSHEFDPARFPTPDAMLRDLHDTLHAHFMISVWPKFYTGTKNFDLFNNKGWLYTRSVQEGDKDWIGYVATFYDAFNPDARHLFWNLMNQYLFTKGVDGWWMDATEPDIISNSSIEQRKALMEPHALGSAARYFNAFPLENARAVYEGQRRAERSAASPEAATSDAPATQPMARNASDSPRVFILTRSAFAGQQRYAAATWSGDIGARWDDMRNQITAGLNFSLSGIPYWTMDIGGFAVEHRYEHPNARDLEEWRELNARWFQFGAFCPLTRVHGQFPYREIFNIAPKDHPAYKSFLYYDKLRYRLLPYIYSLSGKTWKDDYTIMRALVLDFEKDSIARNTPDEYLYGPSLLVNPVYTYGARSRQVYLPAGTGWYDAYTGAYLPGGQTLDANAPYERMPLYVRAGSIIPTGPELQYTDQRPADTLTVYVYTGAGGAFTLYEDEGNNYHYENGSYSTIPMSYDESSHTLTIDRRTGSFPGMLAARTLQIIWITPQHPGSIDGTSGQGNIVLYTGERLTVHP